MCSLVVPSSGHNFIPSGEKRKDSLSTDDAVLPYVELTGKY